MVGAVLTQNTNWTNVSRAIGNLREENLLSLAALASLPEAVLADKIRPSGYFNLKARRLKNLLALISREEPAGDLDRFFSLETISLREKLLSVKGIGPETADSILLYAAQKPVFVVDTYTYRMLTRHGLIGEETDYAEMQDLFVDSLPADVKLFNEFHALIVRLGKEYCKKSRPRCRECPLRQFEPLLVD
ncbi:MAG: endonuclease III domain-containing protein [Proteobacteria bacterium]|nr:endonuclease III domain-containing protein [Pseudomonadota bacterium]MBU4295828.1 endonuclease III domain-containing protein [Pseudomonadota bacterium]